MDKVVRLSNKIVRHSGKGLSRWLSIIEAKDKNVVLAEENVVLAGKGLLRWLSIIEAKDKVEEEKRENFHCQVLKSPPWGDLEESQMTDLRVKMC